MRLTLGKAVAGGDRPPSGFSPITGSKHGGYHKRAGKGWVYWYPGIGVTRGAHAGDAGKVPAKVAQQPEAGKSPTEPAKPAKGIITDPAALPPGFNDMDKRTRAIMTTDWKSVDKQMTERFGDSLPYRGGVKKAIAAHLEQLGRDGYIIPSNVARAKEMLVTMVGYAKKAGLKSGQISELMEKNVRKIAHQETESVRRTLGDHGVRHLSVNAKEGDQIFDALVSSGVKIDPMHRLMAYQAWVDHDMGYTIPAIAKGGFAVENNYHPQASAVLVMQNRKEYEKLFGKDRFGDYLRAVENHSGTNVDWKKDPFGSTIRLADNTHLFADKMPEVLFDRPEAVETLVKIRIASEMIPKPKDGDRSPEGKAKFKRLVAGVKKTLLAEIERRDDLPPRSKALLSEAAREIGELTPKFLISRLAGRAPTFKYDGGDMAVQIEQSDAKGTIGAVFGDDEEDKQFLKLLKDYGTSPDKVTGGKVHVGDSNNGIQFNWTKNSRPSDPVEQRHMDVMARVRSHWNEIQKMPDEKAKNAAIDKFFGVELAKALRLVLSLTKGGKIPGGLASEKSPVDFDRKQLADGTAVELEHTSDRAIAREIAMDHLTEDPDYYRKLKKIEKSAMDALVARTGRAKPTRHTDSPGLVHRAMAAMGKRPAGAGWSAIPGGKRGGMRKMVMGKWVYWYPGMKAGGTQQEAERHVAKQDAEHHDKESAKWREKAAKRHEQGQPGHAVESARAKMRAHATAAENLRAEHKIERR